MNSVFIVLCLQVFSSYYMQSLELQNVYSYPERLKGEDEEYREEGGSGGEEGQWKASNRISE